MIWTASRQHPTPRQDGKGDAVVVMANAAAVNVAVAVPVDEMGLVRMIALVSARGVLLL